MKIAVIGSGAIGSLVAGFLKKKEHNVVLIGRKKAVSAVKKSGLRISGPRGDNTFSIDVFNKLKEKPGLVILAVKTQDIKKALEDNIDFIKDSLVLTTQNGIQADNIVAKYVPKENIVSSIVMFGSTCLKPGIIVHNFEGNWIIGKRFSSNDEKVENLRMILSDAFPVVVSDAITGMKYLKIFINANNCIPGILGHSMQQVFRDKEISQIAIAIWREGLDVVNKANIALASFPNFPLERLNKLTSLPMDTAAEIFSDIMITLSKEPLYGSILQSIKRGKISEIDYINGEFVNIAKRNKFQAALNEKLVNMVHDVEKNNTFFSKEELVSATKDLAGLQGEKDG